MSSRTTAVHSELVAHRMERLLAELPDYLIAYDRDPPFRRPAQLALHRQTITLRRQLGSAAAAIEDAGFTELLYATLQEWGIGSRGSKLRPIDDFRKALRAVRPLVTQLEPWHLDADVLDVTRVGQQLWGVIRDLGIVENKAPLVAGSKALHHILPDLVVPIDREYTRRFFGWWSNRFQYEQRRFLALSFPAFARVARQVPRVDRMGPGWRTSTTKLIDNAIVAFCREERVPRYGG